MENPNISMRDEQINFEYISRINISDDKFLTTNVAEKNDVHTIIEHVLKYLSDTLSRTLGPYGATTLIHKRNGKHFFTKDGYSVIREILFKEPIARVISELITRTSEKMTKTVGDGSTTAVVLANEFYDALKNNKILENYPSQDIFNMIKFISEFLINEIRNLKDDKLIKRNIDINDIRNIALISTNNDIAVVDIIQSIYQENKDDYSSVNINIHQTNNIRTVYTTEQGFPWGRGVTNLVMSNTQNQVKLEVKLEDVYVLMIHGNFAFKDIHIIKELYENVLRKENKGVVIIARSFDAQVDSFVHKLLVDNKHVNNGRGIKLALVDASLSNTKNVEKFYDLASYIQAIPCLDMNGDEPIQYKPSMLGFCDRFHACGNKSTFIVNNLSDNTRLKERINTIQNEIENIDVTMTNDAINLDLGELKGRIKNLNQKIYNINIGGNTSQEVQSRAFLVEDATMAIQSAIKYGIVSGVCLFIPQLLHQNLNSYINTIYQNINISIDKSDIEEILSCLIYAYSQVFFRIIDKPTTSHKTRNKIISNLKLHGVTYNESKEDLAEKLLEFCIGNSHIINVRTLSLVDFKNDLDPNKVINSAETDIEIINTVVNIISLLLNSNQFINSI